MNKGRSPQTTGLRATMFLLLTVFSITAFAQYNSMWYTFDPSVKNYATKIVPNTQRETVMAGTSFNSNGLGVPHFMKLDDGYSTVAGAPGITAQNLFRDNDFVDQRTADIVARDNDEYFIVALAREDINGNPMAKDKIKVIHTNNSAALVAERLYYDPSTDYNLYPMSALYKSANDQLYICGYATTTPTIHPSMPDEHSPKHAFIMTIDISNPSNASTWNIVAMKYFESSPVTGNFPELDWDMALRMQVIENGSNAGDIFLTGSVNALTGGGTGFCNAHVRSATMVHILDPATLDDRYSSARHFVDRGNVFTGEGMMEYGIGLEQDPSGAHNYIVSNIYEATSDACGNSPNDWYNANGFNSKPDRIAVTHANEDFETTFGGGASVNRLIIDPPGDGLVALQTFKSTYIDATSGYTDVTRFCIAGIVYETPNTSAICALQIYGTPYTPANIVPFIYDIEVRFQHNNTPPNNNILGLVTKAPMLISPPGSLIRFYENQGGTGNPGNPNSYADLGGGLSHIFYGTKAMDRNLADLDESVAFNTSKWQHAHADGTPSEKLGLKTYFVHAPNGYNMDGLGSCTNICDPDSDNEFVTNVSDWEEGVSYMYDVPSAFTASINKYENGQCTDNPMVYKPARVSQLKANFTTIMHPNPAVNELNIKLTGSVYGEAEVVLLNVYGQKIATLYKGNTEQLSQGQKMQLPVLVTGIYMVQVHAQNQRIFSGKLKIQQ